MRMYYSIVYSVAYKKSVLSNFQNGLQLFSYSVIQMDYVTESSNSTKREE